MSSTTPQPETEAPKAPVLPGTALLVLLTALISWCFAPRLRADALSAPTFYQPLVADGQLFRVLLHPFMQPDPIQLIVSCLSLLLVASALEAGLGAGWLLLSVLCLTPLAFLAPAGQVVCGWSIPLIGLIFSLLVYAQRSRQAVPRVTLGALIVIWTLAALVSSWGIPALGVAALAGVGLGRLARPVPAVPMLLLFGLLVVGALGWFLKVGVPLRKIKVTVAGFEAQWPVSLRVEGDEARSPDMSVTWKSESFPRRMSVVRDQLLLTAQVSAATRLEKPEIVGDRWLLARSQERLYAWTAQDRRVLRFTFESQRPDRDARARAILDQVHLVEPALDQQLQARFEQASRLLVEHRYEEAEKALGELPPELEFLLCRGVLRFQRGELAGAQDDLEKAASLTPPDARVFSNLGFLRVEQERFGEAVESFTRGLDLGQEQMVGQSFMFDQYNGRAWARLQLGKLDEALKDVERALTYEVPDSQRALALDTRGGIHLAQNQAQEALKDFQEAFKLAPDLAEIALHRVEGLLATGDRSSALAALDAIQGLKGKFQKKAEMLRSKLKGG